MNDAQGFTDVQNQKLVEVGKILEEHFETSVFGVMMEDGNSAQIEHMRVFSFGRPSGIFTLSHVLLGNAQSKFRSGPPAPQPPNIPGQI